MQQRRKRAYIPKIRGCYECSQRRINCDRAQPECAKCLARGIRCSGLGIRYRFQDDASTRRRPNETPQNQEDSRFELIDGDETNEQSEDAMIAEPAVQARKHSHVDIVITTPLQREIHNTILEGEIAEHPAVQSLPLIVHRNNEVASTNASEATAPSFTFWPQLLEPWKEYLLNYFSKRIAPEMAFIDDRHNGWRSLILPVAHADDLVMDAVLSASAFHLAVSRGGYVRDPFSLYAQAITRLRQRQDLITAGSDDVQSVVTTILVLLVTVMVSGWSDFPVIFNLLESALAVIGGDEQLQDGELAQFLRRQIRKLRGHAAPLLSQPQGFARLSMEAANGWEDHWHYVRQHPDQANALFMLADLLNQAGKIYTNRVLLGPEAPPLNDQVEAFQNTLKRFPADSPVAHTLVWATFMTACESSTPEHREFFLDALMKHHRRNHFANIPNALKHLNRIWSRRPEENWTMLLPESRIFMI